MTTKKNDKRKAPSSTVHLKEELQEKEKKFHGLDDIFGMTLLTNPSYISSSRNIMFTSHLRQFVNLMNADFPRVFTNYENVVGKHSTGYYKAKGNLEVFAKIPKFNNGVNNDHSYLLFTYDPEKDYYDVIEKKNVEDLTEKFGFAYNNEVMDSKKEGDKIEKGEVLYKTTSYDVNGNYCYGKNAKFMYMLINETIEDAIVVSDSLSKEMKSKEIETVKVSLNDNDILCNIYGDNEVYQGFPNIGEYVKNHIVCAKRRINNTQLLYDVKKSNLRKINFSSDVLFFNEGRVTDIEIYSNKTYDELEDNVFNKQLKYYLAMQEDYYSRILEVCNQIIDSGSKYSKDIGFYYRKATNILDPDYKWREDDNSVFSNIVVEFVIEREIGLSRGQKITGRYGNKGVISEVWDDDKMPVLETGERVDIIFNTLGVINRLNSQQLFEQSITFITNRVQERMRTLKTLEEKEKLLTRTVWYFNEEQEKKLKEFIKKLPKKGKEQFFENIERDGIYIHIPPMWEKEPLFDRLMKLYDEFDWIEHYDVYVNRFGRKIKILKKLVVGDMYVIKLKQTSKKGFSARSTGSLSKRGVPDKSNKAKIHQELYSKTPIKIGDQENINSAIGVDTNMIAQLHLFYRSSVIGRRDFGEDLMTNLKEMKDFKYSQNFTNRNVEILQAYLKAMGLRIEFSDDQYVIPIKTGEIQDYMLDDMLYIAPDTEIGDIELEHKIRKKYSEGDSVIVGTAREVEEMINEEIQEAKLRRDTYVIDIKL